MRNERIRVLYLDDEENNLNAFKAGFRREYEIYTFSDHVEALRILDEVEIHVAITDQRMPRITGVEFFEKVVQKHPDVVRILLTAYTNSQTIIDAINKGKIHSYVIKPWDPQHLRSVIEASYDTYQARKELQLKNEELLKANEELSRFVYSASHDLRAPLMSILGLVEISRMEKGTGDPYHYLDMIETSVKRLDVFIQNIIDYYQNARSEQSHARINFHVLIKDVIESLKNMDPNIEFKIDIKQSGDFICDEFRLRVILSNIVSNAIKYQKQDSDAPWVEIKIDANAERATIKIGDNGVGILKEHLDNVFKMFFRTKSNQKHSPGTGIGLYIVKEALAKLNGSIDVHSVVNEGTTFTLLIPNHSQMS